MRNRDKQSLKRRGPTDPPGTELRGRKWARVVQCRAAGRGRAWGAGVLPAALGERSLKAGRRDVFWNSLYCNKIFHSCKSRVGIILFLILTAGILFNA